MLWLYCRSPCGERGLKYRKAPIAAESSVAPHAGSVDWNRGLRLKAPMGGRSLPMRGAWIEMRKRRYKNAKNVSRSPCGERGLKWLLLACIGSSWCRSPCGERGLKYESWEKLWARCVAPHAGNAVKLRGIHRVSCFFSLSTWEVWTMFALL